MNGATIKTPSCRLFRVIYLKQTTLLDINVNKNPTDATICRYLSTAKLSSFAVDKYLHTVASVGSLFTLNYDARNHEIKKKLLDI